LRFITEFFRFENPLWLNLTLAQLFSLGLVLISLLIIFIIMRFHGSKSKTR
jgi:prolipoprotein diacylglyceryltransferase